MNPTPNPVESYSHGADPIVPNATTAPVAPTVAVFAPVAEPAGGSVPARGSVLRGRIVALNGDFAFVDVGLRKQALLPVAEFDNGSIPEVGIEMDVVAGEFDAAHEVLAVHRKGTIGAGDVEALTRGTILDGTVTGMIKGGLEVRCGAFHGFMPASQVDCKPLKDISTLLGQDVRCEVLEIDKKHKKVIVSRRTILEREEIESKKGLLEQLEVGQLRHGVVIGLAEFGAFVDIGGVRGLLHVSDMKWSPVEKPSDVVKVGDEFDVKVLKVNKARERISLGLKQVTPDPWTTVDSAFPVGTKLNVRVVKLTEYGAFAEVAEGVNGLIPIGELSWTQRPTRVEEFLEVGKSVEVVVISVDAGRRRIGLSMKQLCTDPWAGIADRFPVNAIVPGTVTKLLEFGALVSVAEGIDGLVHISEMSTQHVKTPGDVVKVGDPVEVKVLGVDARKRRISLSIKGAKAPAEMPASSHDTRPAAPKRERKKPLRGGLASHFQW